MLVQAGLARRIARFRAARLLRQHRTLHQYVCLKPDMAANSDISGPNTLNQSYRLFP